MSKNNSGLRTARDNIMSMSASILRNIVASVLKVDSRNIKLSGEISTSMLCENWSGNSHDQRFDSTQIYGFIPARGLVKLSTLSNSSDSYQGTAPTFGDNAFTFSEQYQNCIFFVLIREGCSQMQSPNPEDYYESFTLYKAPNFKE